MGIIQDQIKNELKMKIREQIAQKQQQQLPIKKTIGGLVSSAGKDITTLAKGVVGLGYQAVRHPIESTKNIGAMVGEFGKQLPSATVGLGKAMGKIITAPIKTTKEGISAYKELRAIPYEEQKKVFNDIAEEFIKSDERGKRVLGVLSAGMVGAGMQEITHPVQYAYEHPVFFALDVLSAGQATGANKAMVGIAKQASTKVPAVAKVQSALKEAFLPNGKLINAGFNDLAKNLTKTKSEIFNTQRKIIEDTTNKFYKEFKLNPKEQTEFFETIDKLRRVGVKEVKPIAEGIIPVKGIPEVIPKVIPVKKAISANPKIQQAINWWLDEEAPKLAKLAGLPEEKAIRNYLYHFFPEKFKSKEISLGKPLLFAKKGYLKKSKDIEGFTKDPVLSISAIKSKVAIDNLKDTFIKNTINSYEVAKNMLSQKLIDAGINIEKFTPEGIIEKAKQVFDLEEYKPKGSLRFYKIKQQPAENILEQIGYQGEQRISQPQLLEQAFVKVGEAINLAEEFGLKVKQKNLPRSLGSATLGGIEKGGKVNLKAFTSEVIAHELGHSFDVGISKIINTKRIYQVELKNLVKKTGLGGSATYQAKAVERFAEYLMSYIHNPKIVQEIAPEFTKYFNANILIKPEIRTLAERLSGFFNKVDELPNIREQLLGLNKGQLEKAIRTAFPPKEMVGVSKDVETHLLPKVIVEELNNFTTPIKGVLDKMFLPFDVFNRNWKPLATAVRPRYHTRNILGNIYNSTIVAGNNPISFVLKDLPIAGYQQIKSVISKEIKNQSILGKVYQKFFGNVLEPNIIKLAVDNDVVGRGFFGADINDLIVAVDKGDDIMKTIKRMNTPAVIYKVPVLKQWLQLSTKVGQFLEDNARLALFKQGLKKFAGNVDEAKSYVDKHLFDYLTGLGEADKIIKRFIPFWSWTRFNIPLQTSSLAKTPLRYAAMQKGVEPYVKNVELTDEGYQYLTQEQKEAGFIKVGTAERTGKEYDKYIKTASVLPIADLNRLVHILQGKEEEIGFTPIFQIYNLITSNPTKFKTFFGQPVEQFKGEKKKFLGVGMTGRTKELLSTIPALTEINKLIGGGYAEEEKPKRIDRVEQILSPLGISLVDKESSKYFSELEKEKELSGSYTAGLQSIYKRYLKKGMKQENEQYIKDNIKNLEIILQQKGLTKIDLLKIKSSAIKAVFQDALIGK